MDGPLASGAVKLACQLSHSAAVELGSGKGVSNFVFDIRVESCTYELLDDIGGCIRLFQTQTVASCLKKIGVDVYDKHI